MRRLELLTTLPFFFSLWGCVDEGPPVGPNTNNTQTDPDPDPDPDPEPDPEPAESLQFASPVTLLQVESDRRIAHGDVDGDGHLDFVVNASGSSLVWLKGDGQGSFSQPKTAWTDTAMRDFVGYLYQHVCNSFSCTLELTFLNRIDLADLNGDGKDELVASFTVIDGKGKYWSAVGAVDLNAEGSIPWILSVDDSYVAAEVIADLDDDGGAEILIYTWHNSYLLRNGGEKSIEPLSVNVAGNYYPQSWTSDLDNDGDLDILSFYNGGFGVQGVTAFLRQEDGQFTEKIVDDEIFGHMAVGNGGARTPATELMLATSESIFWVENGEQPTLFGALDFENLAPWGTVFGDFNGSGSLDLLSPQTEGTVAMTGDGEGGFDSIEVAAFELNYEEVAADINGDGLDDLYRIVWNAEEQVSQLEVLLNESR